MASSYNLGAFENSNKPQKKRFYEKQAKSKPSQAKLSATVILLIQTYIHPDIHTTSPYPICHPQQTLLISNRNQLIIFLIFF